jgi:hypothetical protein
MFSAYHQLTDRWTVMGNIGWQDWSEFGKQDMTLRSTTSTTLTKDLDFGYLALCFGGLSRVSTTPMQSIFSQLT